MVFGLTSMFAYGETEYKETSDSIAQEQTEDAVGQINRAVGMPSLPNATEKRLVKELYELRDDSSLICYAYFQNWEGKFIYYSMVMGYGIPYSAQFSNSEKVVVNKYYSGGSGLYGTLPQSEPNGLFVPEGLSATWLITVNGDGMREIDYVEQEVLVRQSKLPRRMCAEWSLPEDY